MNRAGDQLFACTRFPGDEHRAFRFRDTLRALDDFLHDAAPADDPVVIKLLVAFAAKVPVLGPQPLMVDGAGDHDEQFVDFEWLLQVVERPKLHGFDRALNRGVRGHLRICGRSPSGVELTFSANQIQAAQLRHDVVHEHDVERPLGEQTTLRVAQAGRFNHLMSGASQGARQRLEDFSSSSTSRIEPRISHLDGSERTTLGDRCRRVVSEIQREFDANRGAFSGCAADRDRASQAFTIFLEIGRPRPVPPRLVVKYGSKMRGRSARSMPAPRSAITMATERPSNRVDTETRASSDSLASRALTIRFTSAMRRRSASDRITGTVQSRSTSTLAPGVTCAARPIRGRAC